MSKLDYKQRSAEIEILKGQTLVKCELDGGEILFETGKGEKFKMFYEPDCCASCDIHDIAGELSDLVGSPITMAEEMDRDAKPPEGEDPESYSWTFYKLATINGYVTISWYGESNGYYNESATFERTALPTHPENKDIS